MTQADRRPGRDDVRHRRTMAGGLVRVRRLLALLLFTACLAAHGATLQISPVVVDLKAGENASGITLRNPGDRPLYGQVRVFRWDQSNGDDTLTPTRELVASPPLIQIAGQTEQLIRLVRVAPLSAAPEQNYRVLIDELPPPDTPSANGVTIRLRYSVPVFVEPANATGHPKLSWHLLHDNQGWLLRIDNAGTQRAQIAAVELVNGAGKVYVINKGLLGYALAGRARQWQVPLPPNADMLGTVKVRATINSLPAEVVVIVEQRS